MTADPWFQTLFAERLGGANYGKGTEIYKFEKIKRAKRAVLAAHPERQLLDFGIGENDDMADPLVREVAKLLVINYPNSPTGAVATRDFYRQVIDFALTNKIVVVQDAAHILLTYDQPPLSFLQIDGAREAGVEIHSMSKGFNMIGWRMAFVCGHPKIVQAFSDVKDNSDSGQFMAIQQAAAAALDHPDIGDRTREKYRRRLQKLVAALGKVGFQAKMPGGTYFLYVKAPKT